MRPLQNGLFFWQIIPISPSKLLFWLCEVLLILVSFRHEKRVYACPKCSSKEVLKRGVRRGKLKFFCKSCSGWFQINRSKEKGLKKVLLSHIQGQSFRSIAETNSVTAPTAFRAYLKASKSIPLAIDELVSKLQ